MKALLGRKLGMSQMFSPSGEVVPVTLIQAEPNIVMVRRVADRDGYAGVQLGLPKVPVNELKRPFAKPRERDRQFAAQREFAIEVGDDVEQLAVDQFEVGDVVEVSATSKGKGFQGVVKRHHFKGGPASHGHSDWERRPGSIGQRFPQHTVKGKRMAGRMGADRVTVRNLVIVSVDAEKNLLAIKGAVPGRRGAIVEIKAVTLDT